MTSASVTLADCFLVFFLRIVSIMPRVRTDHGSIWNKPPHSGVMKSRQLIHAWQALRYGQSKRPEA
jgi:hypothetical protein